MRYTVNGRKIDVYARISPQYVFVKPMSSIIRTNGTMITWNGIISAPRQARYAQLLILNDSWAKA